ncbi:MAG: LacI family DNA-binding transcriptional regulator [Chloroflexi bacterium]|nr:LacI family DNA-binding transcriptional regulator [Chloroflexota bacterium]
MSAGDAAAPSSRRTIYDVAQHARVSLATVSRFINESGYVGADARARIEMAIRELDYVPSQPARALGGRGTGLVVLGVRHLANPRWTELALAMETYLRDRGLSLVLMSIGTERERELAALEQMRRLRAEGVAIAMAHAAPGDFDKLRRAGIKVLTLAGFVADPNVDAVFPDRPLGVEIAMEHLIRLGHRRIAIFDSTANLSAMETRVEAHLHVLRQFELEVDPCLILGVEQATMAAADAMAERVRDSGATAVVAIGDVLAIGLWLGLERLGVRVPEEISLVGMDDIELSGAVRSGLTTVGFDRHEQARQVVDLLMARMQGGGPEGPVHWRLAPRLLVRGSTAQVTPEYRGGIVRASFV